MHGGSGGGGGGGGGVCGACDWVELVPDFFEGAFILSACLNFYSHVCKSQLENGSTDFYKI